MHHGTTRYWRVEFHSHTCYSADGWMTPEELIARARARGLDRIFVTDHNTIDGARRAAELAPDLVLVGEEIRTTEGDLLAFFVREAIPAGLTPMEAVARLRRQSAVIVPAHPFDTWRQGFRPETLEAMKPYISAIEGFNARARKPGANTAALTWAEEHHLPAIAGSDAHTPWEVGWAVTELPPFRNAFELRAALLRSRWRARPSPLWVHLGSTLASLRTKLGRSRCR
ncbi:MAG: PHP domain-containing protein [Chloroflexi bacterium]|nr:PHP domain-containing protein [Chloroflexota bacterium]